MKFPIEMDVADVAALLTLLTGGSTRPHSSLYININTRTYKYINYTSIYLYACVSFLHTHTHTHTHNLSLSFSLSLSDVLISALINGIENN